MRVIDPSATEKSATVTASDTVTLDHGHAARLRTAPNSAAATRLE
jgi:hypothetical protein